MWLFALGSICSLIFVPSLQQHCSGRCGTYIIINITTPESVIIPCGSLQPSNTTTVDYCNATGGINEPLDEGATMQYNLTTTEMSHHNNIIYCTDNQVIFCYRLNVFFPPFVPRDYVPSTVPREYANGFVRLVCPFRNAGNPPPFCTWNRLDNNNISHQIEIIHYRNEYDDVSACVVYILFTEADNGLYQCTGHNDFGNSTYTFPEKFIVENCSEFASIAPSFVVSQPPVLNVHDNTTLLCTALGVTKNVSLAWVVDGVVYNSTGTFSSSRGWIMVESSMFDANICKISLSLTVLNVQSNSEGVYTCIVQDSVFTISKNISLTLHMEDSTEESSLAPVLGGAIAGVVVFLIIVIVLVVMATLYYRKDQSKQHYTPTDSLIMSN